MKDRKEKMLGVRISEELFKKLEDFQKKMTKQLDTPVSLKGVVVYILKKFFEGTK